MKKPFLHLCDTLTSTNDFIRRLAVNCSEDQVLVAAALHQTAGRGQRGTSWQSRHGENLLFSGMFPLPGLPADRQFDVSRHVSIFVIRYLQGMGLTDIQIKWPNDILIGGKKIAGILIENNLRGSRLNRTLIGIGLNVNQCDFGELNSATSLSRCSGRTHDLRSLTLDFADRLTGYMVHPLRWTSRVDSVYNEYLYGLGCEVTLSRHGEQGPIPVSGVILGVTEDGRLMQRRHDGQLCYYINKEVSWQY